MKHYVYFLYHPDGMLLYIGRAVDPKKRCAHFMYREGVMAELGKVLEFDDLEEAQRTELRAIADLWPPYNKSLQSSRGHLGHKHPEERKQRIGEKHRGKIVSEESKQKLRITIAGRPSSTKGRVYGPEVIERMRAAARLREAAKKQRREA